MNRTIDDLADDEVRALEALVVSLADDEFVIAERYTEWQVRAPSLESDLALANIAQDELGHARLWYDVLGQLGHDEPALLFERDPADFRHASLCSLPFETGDWADAIVRSYLYDVAEAHRLEALADSSLAAIAGRVPKLVEEETFHRDHAETWLERLVEAEAGRERVQAAIDRLIPHAWSLFEPAAAPNLGVHDDRPDTAALEATIVDSGLRPVGLDTLAEAWFDEVETTLAGLGLEVPADVSPPAACGRNGDHPAAWFDLHDDFTSTYRELGRTDTTRIMPEPDHG